MAFAACAAAEPIRKLTYTNNRIRVAVGDSFSYVPERSPENGEGDVTYTLKKGIVALHDDGTATALQPGSEVISAWWPLPSGKKTRVYLYVSVYQPAEELLLYNNIYLNGSPLEQLDMLKGASATFTVALLPQNAERSDISFSIADENIATVTSRGRVRARAVGTTTLTVTAGGLQRTYPLYVYGKISKIRLDEAPSELMAGQTMTLTANDGNGNAVSAHFISSNPKLASVDARTGVVTALAPGRVRITAKPASGQNKTTYKTITIVAAPEHIELPEILQLPVGASQALLSNQTALPDARWQSSDPQVAIVDEQGIVTACGAGTAEITLTSEALSQLSAKCTVYVGAAVTAIAVNAPTDILWCGDTWMLMPQVSPSNAAYPVLNWQCEPEGIVSIDNAGILTALVPGHVEVTAAAQDGSGVSISFSITVMQEVELMLPYSVELSVGEVYTPPNFDQAEIYWAVSDSSLLTQEADGFRALVPGLVTLTAALGNRHAQCDVHIEQLITGIAFVNTIETMRVGDIFIPLVDCQPLTATNRRVRWESSAPDVVSVSTAGLITAVAPGEATIYAQTLDGSDLSAAMTITVVASN